MDLALHLLSKMFWLIARPGTLGLWLTVLGLVLLWRGYRWGRAPLLAGIGIYLAVLATPVAALLLMPLEDRFGQPDPLPDLVDGVIVLGGAVEQDLTAARGLPTLNGAAERMTELVVLAHRYPMARLAFTGGEGGMVRGPLSEADVARALFTALGVPQGRIIYEDRSRNTWDNARFTFELLRPDADETWLLVTSASHMPRSVGAFRQAGWRVVPWPVDYRTRPGFDGLYAGSFSQRLLMLEIAVHEWIGLAVYRALGRSDALFPGP